MKDGAWEAAKNLAWRLRHRGCLTPRKDVLIPSLSREAGCRIYSADKHFERMGGAGAGIRLYEPGYGGAYDPN